MPAVTPPWGALAHPQAQCQRPARSRGRRLTMLVDAVTPTQMPTTRPLLRPPQPKDAAIMQRLASDEAVARTTGTRPPPYPPGAAQAFIQRLLAANETA